MNEEHIKMSEMEATSGKVVLNRTEEIVIKKIGKKCWKACLDHHIYGMAQTRSKALEALADALFDEHFSNEKNLYTKEVVPYG